LLDHLDHKHRSTAGSRNRRPGPPPRVRVLRGAPRPSREPPWARLWPAQGAWRGSWVPAALMAKSPGVLWGDQRFRSPRVNRKRRAKIQWLGEPMKGRRRKPCLAGALGCTARGGLPPPAAPTAVPFMTDKPRSPSVMGLGPDRGCDVKWRVVPRRRCSLLELNAHLHTRSLAFEVRQRLVETGKHAGGGRHGWHGP